MKTLVIGATNIDIIGLSKKDIIEKESNIGNISISLGGVAKNIATNLLNLGEDVAFLTLIGSDFFSDLERLEFKKLGIDISYSIEKNIKSNIYLAVHDKYGDLITGINDMSSFESLNISDFYPLDEYINTFDVLVFDTNLNEKTLNYLITRYKNKTIYVDGVSQTKVLRIKKVLSYIDLLKINDYELNALANINNCDIIKDIKKILDLGVKNCIISTSNKPIVYNDGNVIYQSEVKEVKDIKSTMGAGDALLAGIIFYLNNNKNIHEAINFGKLVASKTLEVYESCNNLIKMLIDL